MTNPPEISTSGGDAWNPEKSADTPQKMTPIAAYILAGAVGISLIAEAVMRYTGLLWAPYEEPGSAGAAQQFVRDNFANVELVGTPVITGALTVRVFMKFSGEECDVYLRADPDAPNGYGWVIKRLDCDYPGQVHDTPGVTTILATNS